MSVSFTKKEGYTVEFEMTVSAENFEKGMQKSYIKNVKQINIPGFRKGKAPRKYIEKIYTEAIFYDDAINFVFPEEYEAAINAVLQMTDEQKNAWGVIGNICGTNWDTDFSMTEGPDGTYTSDVLELKAGEEFKVRQGASWDVNFGVEFNGGNIVVEADGKYKVQLVWDGNVTGTVTLIPVE